MRKVVVDLPRAASPGVAWTHEDQMRIEGVLAFVMDGLKYAVEQATATTGDKDGAA